MREGADVRLTDIEQDAGERLAAELGVRATFTRLDVREGVGGCRIWAAPTEEGAHCQSLP